MKKKIPLAMMEKKKKGMMKFAMMTKTSSPKKKVYIYFKFIQ